MKHMETSCYGDLHMKILNQITGLKGFLGSRLYGTHVPDAVGVAHVTQPPPPPPADKMTFDEDIDREEGLEEEQAGEDRDDAVLGAYYNVLEFSYDGTTVHLTG